MASVPAIANDQPGNALALPPEAERFQLRQRQARMFAQSLLVPAHLRNGTPEAAMANCYIALTLAEAMGEMPLIVMQNIHVINGKAGFASKYMIARANASGKFKDDLDWGIGGAGSTLSATCFATLAKSGRRVEMTVDMAMAKAEGWTKNAKYQTMPELMLRYRSASFLVNLYAPEVMLGYRTTEELEDLTVSGAIVESEPLTGAALLEQARDDTPNGTATGATDAAADPNTVEEVADSAEGRDTADMGENDVLRATADRLIAEARGKELLPDLKRWEDGAEFNDAYGSLDDDLKLEVDAAIAERRRKLGAA